MFITYEGIDGSGKGTQINLLKDYLESNGVKVWVTKEPTDNPIGTLIRDIQKGKLINNPNRDTMLFLYNADRAEHQKDIKEHLDKNEVVICDRYYDSTKAYQVTNEDFLLKDDLFTNFIVPDVTFIIDIPVKVAMERIDTRGEEKEIFEKKDFLEIVRRNYKYIRDMNEGKTVSRTIYMIDGNKDPENVFSDIKRKLKLI